MKNKKGSAKGVNSSHFSLQTKNLGRPTDSRSDYSLEKKTVGKGSMEVNKPEGFQFP